MPHYLLYQFRPFDTIDAILKLKGRHNYTREEILLLRERFNELNGLVVPRPGDIFKIPLEELVTDDYGNLVKVSAVLVEPVVEPGPGSDGKHPPEQEHSSDPGEPMHGLPAEPGTTAHPEQASQQHRNEQVPPDPGKDPGEDVQENAKQPTLSVTGSRRR